jgi:DNA-binding NtrC family response regulator
MAQPRILVVEDDPEMRRALVEALERAGHSVHSASDGLAALHRLAAEPYALVVSDLRMPEMNGLELLRRARELHPEIPVVLITAFGRVDEAVQAMKAGAFDFLQKPFRAEALEEVVQRAMRGEEGRPASPERAVETLEERTFVTQDARTRRLLETLRAIGQSKVTVLISGESGTGKEVLARYIHHHSSRRDKALVAVNCAALPATLLESELFGHEKGAFTGAVCQRIGRFEQAHGGTLLLDEVTEIDLNLQAKLLRALQEGEVDRIGGRRPVKVDVRIIATTNRDLATAVSQGKLREDLYYRLSVFPVELPPLRERPGDIPLLAQYFVERHNARNGCSVKGISRAALELLKVQRWPGNVRELENCLERAVLLAREGTIEPEHLLLGVGPAPAAPAGAETCNLRQHERRLILQALRETGGNRTEASRRLGISIRTLRNKLREYRGAGLLGPD